VQPKKEAPGDWEKERLRLLMRAEKAETRIAMIESQMVDNSKKAAREIGKLRMQLNEEKAKAKGGFGKPSTMKLGEMPKPAGAAGVPFAAKPMPGMHNASGAMLKPSAAAPLAPVK
jgi:hypothetical protein